MQIMNYGFEVLNSDDFISKLKMIELAGRTAYKSEGRITNDSYKSFLGAIIKRGHESVIEHSSLTVKFTVDRGVSHELVRHRLCAFTQESTRYVTSCEKVKLEVNNVDDVLFYYNNGFSMKKISELSDGFYTEWEIYKILEEGGVQKRGLGNRGIVYDDFFDNIDTVEKAYLLGMIMADGCLLRNGRGITITQHKDCFWYLWLMVHNFIYSNVGHSKDKSCECISFASKGLWDGLYSKGIVPNKSHEFGEKEAELLWSSVSDEFKPDFLRGYLEGDGYIREYYQNNPGRTYSIQAGWCGPEGLLVKISKYIFDKYNYKINVGKVSGTDLLYRCVMTKPDVAKVILTDMYKNFKFPYGHPAKSCRALDIIGRNYEMAEWGDSNFKVILPSFWKNSPVLWIWAEAMYNSELGYSNMLEVGATPQEARSLLPNSLKTEIIVTANFREWRHIFKLRTHQASHPQIREVMKDLLVELKKHIPVIFDDLGQ